MSSASFPNDNVMTKCDAQQQSYKNGQDSRVSKSHRRPSITPQSKDEASEAATRSEQTSSNHSLPVSPSYMATKEQEEAMYPIINNVRTLQVPEQSSTNQGGMPTVVHNPQPSGQTTNSTIHSVDDGQTSIKNTQITPQRPQDLLDNVSLDLARVNVKSSAQYRKSYAFKIWRDKGSFPYRLAEQPVVKEVAERKKSKKYLNAVRAQKDRKNEETWRTFKSCRTTNNEMKYRRTSRLLRIRTEETLMTHCEREQLNTILSDCQDKEPKARTNIKHQNSIPDYFKNKKESTQKSQPLASPTKSIPTSVIHVNMTKASAVSKQTTQAEQSMITSDSTVNGDVIKSTTQAGVRLTSNQISEGKLLAGTQEEHISFSQWSDAQTSSGNYSIKHVQSQEHMNANAVNDLQQLTTKTITTCRSSEDSSFFNFNELTDNYMQGGENTERLSTEIECNGKDVSDQSLTPSQTVEAIVSSGLDNSNLTSIIKKSLAKKYSKENVKPNLSSSACGRGRKRARNESSGSEEGERQRARVKQEKATMFTRLDETVATNLADGIHNVNSEYFPIEALANKAAKETSNANGNELESNTVQTTSTTIKHKLDEIERARLLLKELFDVTSESGGDNEMKTFDVASRSFGRKNILNHLSLIDRYFAEFQKKLSSKERPASLP